MIDAQWLTSSVYTSQVNGDQDCFFGFNFSDGRIKCYGLEQTPAGGYFAQYVRGNTEYGINDYSDNGDDTISDAATSLTWQQGDDGEMYDWNGALDYCSALSLGGQTIGGFRTSRSFTASSSTAVLLMQPIRRRSIRSSR